jgi:hypothetical protein
LLKLLDVLIIIMANHLLLTNLCDNTKQANISIYSNYVTDISTIK